LGARPGARLVPVHAESWCDPISVLVDLVVEGRRLRVLLGLLHLIPLLDHFDVETGNVRAGEVHVWIAQKTLDPVGSDAANMGRL